jgi:hypothetical protein
LFRSPFNTTRMRQHTLPIALLLAATCAAQDPYAGEVIEPPIKSPVVLVLELDSLQYFHDPDTGYTGIFAVPQLRQRSVFPDGLTIRLDLFEPAVTGLETGYLCDCDDGYWGLGGGDLYWGDGCSDLVFKFGCRTGYMQVFIIRVCQGSDMVDVTYHQEEPDGRFGFLARSRMRTEALVQHTGGP